MADPGAETIAFYDLHASSYAAQTSQLDLSPLYARFLRHVPPGGRILDAGCGTGRDSQAFVERGYQVVGFDASAAMVRLARERLAGLAEIHQLGFAEVQWHRSFDAVWSCASLLHVPQAEFASVATQLVDTLRDGGAWYMSFKLGIGERAVDGRLFTDHTEPTLQAALQAVPIRVVDIWQSDDLRSGRPGEHWLNALAIVSR